MKDGYAYELEPGRDWKTAPNDDWDTVMVVPSEAATAETVGRRIIDDRLCVVNRAADGRHWAQLAHYA